MDQRRSRDRPVSVVVPTYREAENLEPLVERLKRVSAEHRLDLELLIVDDQSDDGSAEVFDRLGESSWARFIVRRGARSLSLAVLEGLGLARGEILVVMDGDLSHPPEAIPRLLDALDEPGVDFALASRYVAGSSIGEDWAPWRRLESTIATWLARRLVPAVNDPMSGYFALERATFARAENLHPVGYKIALELLVKCPASRIREIPIHFSERHRGKSKLGFREQWNYVRHLARLSRYRIAVWAGIH